MSTFEALAVKYMTDLIADFGFADFQAAAIPGNGGEESGGFTKMQEISPIGGGAGGLGPYQWTGPRRREYEAWLADRNAKPGDYEADYAFLYRDLIGPAHGGNKTAPAGIVAAIKAATTLEDATKAFMDTFERPNPQYAHLEVRIDYARKALAAYHAAGAPKRSSSPVLSGEVLAPIKLPPAADLAPLLNVLAPILIQALQNRTLGPTSAGAQSGDPRAALLPAALQLLGGVAQKPPPPPPPPPATLGSASASNTSVKVSAGAFSIGALLQMLGFVGTPFGMGQEPTLAGTLTTAIPILAGVVGGFGGWGSVAAMALNVVGSVVTAAQKQKATK